jgi:transposase
LTIHVHEADKLSLEQIGAFLNASQEIGFEGETREQIYHWIEQVLVRQEYHQQKRPARGLLRSYVAKMTGLSRAQVTWLIARYGKSGSLGPAPYRRHRFAQRYTRADIELLAIVDEARDHWKFRLYWSLVGPFSGFMRKAILKQVKTETESRVEPNPPKVWTKD